MKIPKYIQDKMRKAAFYSRKSQILVEEVDQYIKDNYDGTEENSDDHLEPWRCGNGISLEELEYGNDITDKFTEWALSDFIN